MALTRKYLAAMGIEEEKIEQIVNAHAESLEGVTADRDKYKAEAAKYEAVQKELDGLKAKGEDPYKKKYEDEHTAFEKYKSDVAAKELRSQKEAAYREILKDASLSEDGIKKALKYADFDTIELEDDGKVKDAKVKMKEAKDEWAAYVVTSETKGAKTAHPPKETETHAKTREEILKIKDTGERQRAWGEYLAEQQKG